MGVAAATARSAYGAENVLSAVGCRDGMLAAVGAKSGGVHGNPRVSTWRQLADGSVREVPAEFEVSGGPDAVNVGRIAGGPQGWVIAGNRGTGAAAWSSPDATEFRLVSGVPPLARGRTGRTWAATWRRRRRGGCWWGRRRVRPAAARRCGRRRTVWAGGGRRSPAPTRAIFQRVARAGERLVAVGRRGDGLGAWIDGPGAGSVRVGWRPGGALPGGASVQVGGLAAVNGDALAVVP